MSPAELGIATGSHGDYDWLSTDRFELENLLQKCPQIFIGKFVAVTSWDSGFLSLTTDQERAGWQSKNGITHSPRIESIKELSCGGFDEWYLSTSPLNLGEPWRDNVFKAPDRPGNLCVLVNFGDFGLHNSGPLQALTTIFWRQMDWIQPESYVADGNAFLTFVTRNKGLFAEALHALKD